MFTIGKNKRIEKIGKNLRKGWKKKKKKSTFRAFGSRALVHFQKKTGS